MRRQSLTRQTEQQFQSMLQIGTSKFQAKRNGTVTEGIFSWSTFRAYLKHACFFTNWCKEKKGCRTLEECKPFVKEWMETRKHLSPYTQKLEISALRKLYQDEFEEVKTPPRKRDGITRSRGEKARDKHFSEENHKDLVTFCKCTGLRRAELKALTPLDIMDGFVSVNKGAKGGRERLSPITCQTKEEEEVIARLRCRTSKKVFDKVPGAADIHGYRAEYATRIYLNNARPLETLERKEKYFCRNDRKGTVFDRNAMLEASRALGHNRISVVGEHYLRLDQESEGAE